MSNQQRRTMQDTRTTLPPAEVLAAAKAYFARRHGIYAAFLEKEGPTFVNLRGQGGEEIVIGVAVDAGATRVTGSTYLFDQQVARFLATLPSIPTEDAASGPAEVGSEPPTDQTSHDARPPAGIAPAAAQQAGKGA